MIAKYEMTLKVAVIHEVDEITEIKSDREFAESIATMICDEAVQVNAVAQCDIVSSSLDVK